MEREADLWQATGAGADAAGEASGAEPRTSSRARGAAAVRRNGETGGQRPIAHKEYYSISEVCDLVGLKPHVLRYWESQFSGLNPPKNRSGNRVYQRKEIKQILLVQHLLYQEKYTIEGAKQRLEQLRRGGELQAATARALDREMLGLLRAELHQALEILSPGTDS
jgi:DNA-binding transcriptional MerR regulator